MPTYYLSFPDAEEETTETQSDDEPQCVVHYPELMSNKPSRIILLSDRSYGKLIECKNVRMSIGGEACHDQCETIPAPSYDPQRDGYHRQCYMKFVKIKTNTKVSTVENYSENQNKSQEENLSDEIQNPNESYSDRIKTALGNLTDQSKAEQEIHSNHGIKSENQSETKHEYYSSESKNKHENSTDDCKNEQVKYSNGNQYENEQPCENESQVQCGVVHKNYEDQTKEKEHKDCTGPSKRMKRRNSENHRKNTYKDHNGFQN